MNVLGLDLSLNATGLSYAYPQRPGRHAVTLTMKPAHGPKRYCQIRDAIRYYVHNCRYNLAMIEAVPPYMNNTASLERVHGVAQEVLARYDIPFAYVSPTALKLFATGDGKADKPAMIAAATACGWAPNDSDQADALWLAAMGETVLDGDILFHAGHKLAALSTVVWPLRPGDPDWVHPYGDAERKVRKPVIKKCRDGYQSLRNGDVWLHPFDVTVCTKPPK